ncbi:glycosyltransferase family 25 protein [Cadophora sp. DSE1049]|nr:glycosyltransferase family 25 protein [Cadophora sp. DSE1049]
MRTILLGLWADEAQFQKIFVINMPSRTDRRDAISLAAAVSDLNVDFIEGVGGDSIPEAALPPEGSSESIKLSKGIKGSWRALIFEDDVDWDIRLRYQLDTFSGASRFLSTKPDPDLTGYHVESTMNPEDPEKSIHNDSSPYPISPALQSLLLSSAASGQPDISLPYGDPANWDVLWLGHCGAGFPRTPPTDEIEQTVQNVILTHPNDHTVPLPKYLRAHPFGPLDALAASHSPHTRVYHRASGGALCTVAYAVSQRGARRLLHEFGVKRWSRIWDVEMGDWCAGQDAPPPKSPMPERRGISEKEKRSRSERVCVTVQPPIFAHHHPPGGESNIGGVGGGYARTVETKYVRLSVRLNLDALLRGEGEDDLVDQWPD